MAWWQQKNWNSSLRDTLQRAAESVHTLVEQAESDLKQHREHLKQHGEELLASAQSLAEQAETSFRESADNLASNVSAFGWLESFGKGDAHSEEEMLRRFEGETRALVAATSSVTEDRLNVISETLFLWETRLARAVENHGNRNVGAYGALPFASRTLRAFLRSQAMNATLAALARCRDGRAVLHAVASLSVQSLATAEALPSPCKEAMPEKDPAEEAAADLWRLISRSSRVPTPLLVELLSLLVEVCEAEALQADHDSNAELLGNTNIAVAGMGAVVELDALSADVDWVLAIFAAAFSDSEEAALLSQEALRRTVERAMSGFNENSDAIAASGGEGDCADWLRQLDAADASGRSFRSLRGLCQELSAPDAISVAEDDSTPTPAALKSKELSAMREEKRQRADELGILVEECLNVGQNFQAQLATSSEGFQEELLSLRKQQADQASRIEELQKERADLWVKLKLVDEQLALAQKEFSTISICEHKISASASRVADQLRSEISTSEFVHDRLQQRRRRVDEALKVSTNVEEQLAKRNEEFRALSSACLHCSQTTARRPALASACMEAERARRKHFDDLLASWHGAIWGPDAEALIRDAAALAMVRGLHMRAGALAEQASREVAQANISVLTVDPDFLEDLVGASEHYKEMVQQLQANLERLTRLEAAQALTLKTAPALAPLQRQQTPPLPLHVIPNCNYVANGDGTPRSLYHDASRSGAGISSVIFASDTGGI